MELWISRNDRRSLLISFFVHFAALALLLILGARPYSPPTERSITWIELEPVTSKKDSLSKRVVQTQLVEKSKDTTPDAFLGEQTQKVFRESVSMKRQSVGNTQAQPAQKAEKAQEKVVAAPQSQAPALTLSKFGVALAPSPTPKQQAAKEARAGRESTLSEAGTQSPQDFVEGIRESDQTALNTREFTYFGYFQRIRDRLDLAWRKNLRNKITKIYYSGRQLASEFDHKTQVLVSLNALGEVTRVQMVEGSGTVDLDDAAVNAFREAGPFPNPPKGLLGNQNQIDVRWEFVLRS